mgnify:FL=1
MTTSTDYIRIKRGTPYGYTTIEGELTLVTFKEGDTFVVYCPSLDISDYGGDESEAKKNFRTHLEMYFEYAVSEGTLWKDLRSHGWDVRSKAQKKTKAPTFDQLKDRLPSLRQITEQGGYDISHQPISHQLSPAA